jgi:hypothetical protein
MLLTSKVREKVAKNVKALNAMEGEDDVDLDGVDIAALTTGPQVQA